jgi:CxxC motif-containing protein (DUF1111 family)
VPPDATEFSVRVVPDAFGAGLIDAISDSSIEANAAFQASDPSLQSMGIHGVPNYVPDLNGVLRPGRFGRKAFEPTLIQQVALALQHDVGVTNPIQPNEDLPSGNPIPQECKVSALTPDDKTGVRTVTLSWFFVFLAPPPAQPVSDSAAAGQAVFNSIGCASCHLPTMTTGANAQFVLAIDPSTGRVTKSQRSAALSNHAVNLYSDLLLHDMGPALADGFALEAQAKGSQWKTTPLWGLSNRTLYLHDGRATDLTTAILTHGGEAQAVVNSFQTLSSAEQANLLAFLNSL